MLPIHSDLVIQCEVIKIRLEPEGESRFAFQITRLKRMQVKTLFVLCFWLSAHGTNAEDLDGVQQLTSILQKLDELQNTVDTLQSTVKTQNNRISALEKQNQYLEETVKAQAEAIAMFRSYTRYRKSQSSCEKKCSKLEKQLQHIMNLWNENKVSAGSPCGSGSNSKQHEGSLIRKGMIFI
jgi:septal ring factor EnvC (AmiA/AmiB activator)